MEGYYNISSGFGKRTSGTHRGIDIDSYGGAGSIAGAAVRAAKGGKVYAFNASCTHNYGKKTSCGCGGGYGIFVYVRHDDGTEARYAHLGAVAVSYGEIVLQGETLGTVGSTGFSSGFHLHFELRDAGGNAVNSMPVNAEGRHTYYGSSAPFSEAVCYRYNTDRIWAEVKNGHILVQTAAAPADSLVLVVQYSGGRLVSADVATASAQISLAEGADSAKVMLWKGISPVTKAVFLQW